MGLENDFNEVMSLVIYNFIKLWIYEWINLWARPVIAVGGLMWFIYVDAEVRAPVLACRYVVDEMATRPTLDEEEKFF